MDDFSLWCAAIGAWLLVAGPLYQGAMELREVADDSIDQLSGISRPEQKPSGVSPWWWLLPPVAVALIWRSGQRQRREFVSSLPAGTRKVMFTFQSKAQAWLLVAAGAFLIALKETWHLVHAMHWGLPVYIAIVVVASILSFGHTALRMKDNEPLIAS
ncbi:hypothetical protein J2Y69_002787 [Microbacterium resistens]|uniref:DUF1648 domain-containing protein n=1 Tax=Microbacterium resistens TaxID=156977 RepID=A0ABU1SEY5_9MICO|nr:hypothetical protein [Microbacterium resistens]MDR6868176.1 hypothetical protein [Microbacterium resistens]